MRDSDVELNRQNRQLTGSEKNGRSITSALRARHNWTAIVRRVPQPGEARPIAKAVQPPRGNPSALLGLEKGLE
jgi:hypothetical protein